MATKPRAKSPAKKKPAKQSAAKKSSAKPKKKAAAGPKKRAARTPAAARKGVVELRQAENLIEAELDRPSGRPDAVQTRATPAASVSSEAILSRAAGGVREKDITAFLRQLIMMLDAGTPILKSLKSLARRGDRKALRDMIGGIAEYVESGNPLWQAFAREGKYFAPIDVNLIKASEASGTLTTVLKRIADYREQRARLLRSLKVAMIYPSLLLFGCVGVVLVLSAFVLPAFKEAFENMGAEISGFSQFVMSTSDFVSAYWWVPVALLVAFVLFHNFYWVKNPLRRLQSDKVKLKIPIWGSIVQRSVIADFTNTFSMLLRSGISMLATLDLCKNAVTNHAYHSVIQDMRDSVENGEGLEAPLRQAEKDGYLPGIVVDMLVTGEESGALEQVSDQIAVIYEEEVEVAIDGIKESIVPIFVIGMGIVVGTMVFALFLPLISMIDSMAGGGL